MRVTYDPEKREQTLRERGLDFEDAEPVFAGVTLEVEDMRRRRVARIATSSAWGKQMPANKPASRRSLKADLVRVDAHKIKKEEYDELPEFSEDMLARAKLKKGGRPVSLNPRKQLTLRLPADVIERWKATGPGWQTRMADRLSKLR